MKKAIGLAVLATAVLAAAATAGVSALGGTVTADGSSTVGPYAIAAAEGFQKKNPALASRSASPARAVASSASAATRSTSQTRRGR